MPIIGKAISPLVHLGSGLNTFDSLAPSALTATEINDTQIDLAWTVNSTNQDGSKVYISTDNITFTLKGTIIGNTATYSATGLDLYTRYYFKVVAYKGSTESLPATVDKYTLYSMLLTSTGDGTGISTLRLNISANTSVSLTGTAKFYTDAAGTLGESTTWNITTGGVRTIYLKCPSATAKIIFADATKVIGLGGVEISQGWVSSTNAASLAFDVSKLINNLQLFIGGTAILTGAFLSKVTGLRVSENTVSRTSLTPMPASLTYVNINSSAYDWTGLDFTGSGNITFFNLQNYRISKMSSADMITLLTSLTNRVGSLPATITINDYADYASPPAGVVTAVNALKAAKSITTVNLGA